MIIDFSCICDFGLGSCFKVENLQVNLLYPQYLNLRSWDNKITRFTHGKVSSQDSKCNICNAKNNVPGLKYVAQFSSRFTVEMAESTW